MATDSQSGQDDEAPSKPERPDRLTVQSVEKAFRILAAFDAARPTMSLTQVAAAVDLDKSAAQRFTHTLTKLGYLRKDPTTKHFELSVKTLDLGYHYTRASGLVDRAMPYLMHLSKTTEETVNLTVRDDTEIVFVSRFMSRHVLNTDVMIGTRMPAYCTAPGIAMLSRLPHADVIDVLNRSDRRPFTQHTTWEMEPLTEKIRQSAEQGYAVAVEEFYWSDISIAAAIVDARQRPIGAINIAVSKARYAPEEAIETFGPLVMAATRSLS